MSWFGDGTFKQDVLNDIKSAAASHRMSWTQACAGVAEVLSHMCDTAFYSDRVLKEAREEGREQARQELMRTLAAAKVNGTNLPAVAEVKLT